MSEYGQIRKILTEDIGFISHIVKTIVSPNEKNADLACVVLANMSKDDGIGKVFELQKLSSSTVKTAVDEMVDCFVQGFDKKLNPYASFDYLAFVFADLTRLTDGRRYFTTRQPYDNEVPLSKVAVFTEYEKSTVRRAGVASTIKNCLFELNAHTELLRKATVNLLPYILLPIAGPEELSDEETFELPDELQFLSTEKKRETDPEILRVHVESLVLLGATRFGRDFMRGNGVYPLVRELHLNIDNEDLRETCERFVQLIMADEPNEVPQKQRLQIAEAEEEAEEHALEAL
ncbi:hypothetical protein V1511DRAFT_505876 [Dipodascopsis uninucleata]